MTDSVDVLIAGAGPTGLALACDLARRGARIRIVDAADHGFAGSRAKGLQARTQEILYDLGVLDDIRAHSTPYPLLGIHAGPLTLPWRIAKRHPPTDDVPFPNLLLCAQADTDAALRRRLEDLGHTVTYATRLVSFDDHADGVTAQLETASGVETVHARYLVGTDGGGSTVRKQAAIAFTGETDDADQWIIADVVIDGLSRNRWHIWPRTAGRMMALCPLPGGRTFQLMLRLTPDEQPDLTLKAIDALVNRLSGRSQLRVRTVSWSSAFRPNVRLADRYRAGNVFLAGDAAHVHTPTGGQGLNTGVQDAYNLGWKLGQVLAGAPDTLLDTYQAERRPVAARVLGLSSQHYENLSRKPLAAARRGDEERQLALTYRGGPLAPHTTGPGVVRAGDRAPDATYTDHENRGGRLFDTFTGPHFTLLAVGDRAITAANALRWPHDGAPLQTVRVPSTAITTLTATYGTAGPTHILVRPDGYIAYAANAGWHDAFQSAAELMLPAV